MERFEGFTIEEAHFGSATLKGPFGIAVSPVPDSHIYVVLGRGAWFHAPSIQRDPIFCEPGSAMGVAPHIAHSWRAERDGILGAPEKSFPLNSSRLPVDVGTEAQETTIIMGRTPIWEARFFVVEAPLIHIPADETAQMTRILSYLKALDECLEGTGQNSEAKAAILRFAEILVYEVMRYWTKTAPDVFAYPLVGVSEPHIFQALKAFHGAPEKAWTTDTLARSAHLGRSVFIARFKKATGKTPRDYIRFVRLRRAPILMRESPAPLSEIAEAVGYGSEASFIRAFHREFDMTPSEYRKRFREA